tara:strand:+ start:60 stop:299 length:240 start_codon:yes stop_codon:yes gene_type:complete
VFLGISDLVGSRRFYGQLLIGYISYFSSFYNFFEVEFLFFEGLSSINGSIFSVELFISLGISFFFQVGHINSTHAMFPF